jgi:hypothetical protein
MSKTGRNDPCPCGSGKKHKHCCGRQERRPGTMGARIALGALVVVVALALTFVYQASRDGVSTPEAYEYDAMSNRYFDPEHGHWHDGPPPDGQAAETDGPTPADWYYDAANDRHWNPEHDHWHDGLPPLDSGAPAAVAADVVTRGADAEPAADPEPWEYDAVNDRHWNPDDRQWHDGPPVSE